MGKTKLCFVWGSGVFDDSECGAEVVVKKGGLLKALLCGKNLFVYDACAIVSGVVQCIVNTPNNRYAV